MKFRGQVLVEFALILPLLLLVLLQGLQLGLIEVRTLELQFATSEAAIAGASEPSPARRCDTAQTVFDEAFSRPADPVKCTAIGEDFTVQASYGVAVISPFQADRDGDGLVQLTASKTARVRR